MISNGAGNSRVFELRAPMMVKNDYSDVTMKCSVWQKDMDVIGAFAKKMRVPTPLFSATLPVYAAALKGGHAERRHRRGLRRAGGQGERQAPQGAVTRLRRILRPCADFAAPGHCRLRIEHRSWSNRFLLERSSRQDGLAACLNLM